MADLHEEEQRLLAVVNKWENVDRSKAAVALKALDKLWPEMERAEALVVTTKRPPKLTLAPPPACGIRPLALERADVAHAEGATPILRGVDLEVARGQRVILRGPNGAGKSTLLKALSGALPLAAGSRAVDERLRLGVFAQDLAQELPQDRGAYEYVAETVRGDDPSIEDTRIRTVMGSIGLTGEKATRRIGSLSGGDMIDLLASAIGMIRKDCEAKAALLEETVKALEEADPAAAALRAKLEKSDGDDGADEDDGLVLSREALTTIVATWILNPYVNKEVLAEIDAVAALEMKD